MFFELLDNLYQISYEIDVYEFVQMEDWCARSQAVPSQLHPQVLSAGVDTTVRGWGPRGTEPPDVDTTPPPRLGQSGHSPEPQSNSAMQNIRTCKRYTSPRKRKKTHENV